MQGPYFASVQEYAQHFTESEYWRPFIEIVRERHGLPAYQHLRAGLPGTHPVFILDEKYVLKFYTHFFGESTTISRELDLYTLFARFPQLPFPALIASGNLLSEEGAWPWPYIITSALPGTSIGEVYDQVSYADKLALANSLGSLLHTFHRLPLPDKPYFGRSTFLDLLARQRADCNERHRRWQVLPEHLISQIDEYLPPITALTRQQDRYLLHADLNQDHVLGSSENGHWHCTGIIDFGDARTGDRLYELIALHIGLFHCDKQLLRAFLESYGMSEVYQEDFVLKAMSFTLLFEFDVFNEIFHYMPNTRGCQSLSELATSIWDIAS